MQTNVRMYVCVYVWRVEINLLSATATFRCLLPLLPLIYFGSLTPLISSALPNQAKSLLQISCLSWNLVKTAAVYLWSPSNRMCKPNFQSSVKAMVGIGWYAHIFLQSYYLAIENTKYHKNVWMYVCSVVPIIKPFICFTQ